MDEILKLLEKLNFTKTEAAVYIELLKYNKLNGYQIAKNLNMSRSSVYSALDNLYKKGVVFLMPGDTQVYQAETPTNLINKMKNDFNETTEQLEIMLKSLGTHSYEERYLNLEGYDNVVAKAKELLLTAEKEVYINMDFNPQIFAKEINELLNKKIRIIAFSFSSLDTSGLNIELYTHNECNSIDHPTRIMMVVDCKTTLVADRGPHRAEFIGTFTDNILLTSIVSEHIHNDIYLLKLQNKYQKQLIEDSMKLNTILENR